MCVTADIYEQRYPALFLDLSSQMKIDSRFITREIIANAVANFAQRISYDKVNWFRIVSIFCFATALATDCKKRQDSSIFIEMIPDIVAKEAFSNRIVDWVVKQGGWRKIEDYTRQK